MFAFSMIPVMFSFQMLIVKQFFAKFIMTKAFFEDFFKDLNFM